MCQTLHNGTSTSWRRVRYVSHLVRRQSSTSSFGHVSRSCCEIPTCPTSRILGISRRFVDILHHSSAVSLVKFENAFVHAAVNELHFSLTVSLVFAPIPIVTAPVVIQHDAHAIAHITQPISFVTTPIQLHTSSCVMPAPHSCSEVSDTKDPPALICDVLHVLDHPRYDAVLDTS